MLQQIMSHSAAYVIDADAKMRDRPGLCRMPDCYGIMTSVADTGFRIDGEGTMCAILVKNTTQVRGHYTTHISRERPQQRRVVNGSTVD